MTENRFVEYYAGRTIKKLIGIEDTETNRVCVTIEENICLLNELADENKELKEENEKLKNKLKFFNELNKPYGDIIKENEQLKQSNKDAWNLIQFIYEEIKEDGSMDWGRIQDLVEF